MLRVNQLSATKSQRTYLMIQHSGHVVMRFTSWFTNPSKLPALFDPEYPWIFTPLRSEDRSSM